MKRIRLMMVFICLCLCCVMSVAQSEDERCSELYTITKGDKVGFIDVDGTIVVEPVWDEVSQSFWDETLVFVRQRKLWGIVTVDGKTLAEPSYSEKPDAWSGEEEPILVKVGKNYGFIDKKGNTIVEPKWKGAKSFNNGFAIVNAGSEKSPKYGYIDLTGTTVVEPQFADALPFSGGLAAVKVKKQYGYIDTTGAMVIEPQFEAAAGHVNGLACVKIDGKYGYIDLAGNVVIEAQFEEAETFFIDSDHTGVKVDGQWGVINVEGKYQIQPEWDEKVWTIDPLWVVAKEGKYGAVDHTGKIMIPVVYDAVEGVTDRKTKKDYYWVRQGTVWGVFDAEGNLLCDPQWEAGENYSPYFLGTYDEFTKAGSDYLVDITGNGIKLAAYSMTAVGEKSILVKKDFLSRTSSLLTPEGELIQTVECIMPFYMGNGLYSISGNGGRNGLMDEEGNIVSSPQWDSLVFIWDEGGLGEIKQGDCKGYINTAGKVVYWSDRNGNPIEYINWFEGLDAANPLDVPFFLPGIHWGMTADEIMDTNPHSSKPLRAGGFIFYTDVPVLTSPKATVTYSCSAEKGDLLDTLVIQMDTESESLYDDFSLLRDLLKGQYGNSSYENKEWKNSSYQKKYEGKMDEAIRKGYYSETVSFSTKDGINHLLTIKSDKGEVNSILFTYYSGSRDLRSFYETDTGI